MLPSFIKADQVDLIASSVSTIIIRFQFLKQSCNFITYIPSESIYENREQEGIWRSCIPFYLSGLACVMDRTLCTAMWLLLLVCLLI